MLPLAGGLPCPHTFPRKALSAAFLASVSAPSCAALQYGWAEGAPDLRRHVSAIMRRRGVEIDPDEALITSGAQQALAIAARIVGDESPFIAVDAETYPGALAAFSAQGLSIVTGRDLSYRYVMPAVANPGGLGMSVEARQRMMAVARLVIEDDAYGELRFSSKVPRPLVADAPERVLYVGTFSKTLAPGLRVGWLIAPGRLHDRALALKEEIDLQASSLAQAVLAAYLDTGAYPEHVARLRPIYGRRARGLAAALRRWLPAWQFTMPEGGFSIWALPDAGTEADEAAFLAYAIQEGVSFDPGSGFRASTGGHPMAMRLCFSSIEEWSIEEAVQRLAAAWQSFRNRPLRAMDNPVLRADRPAPALRATGP